ncbi:MAG: DUF2892 domain-containing protein [Nitrospiraceae bacterium]
MACNLGNTERAIRVIVGGILVTVGYLADISMGAVIAVYLSGTIALMSGIAGFCPAWKLLGINTCPVHQPTKE